MANENFTIKKNGNEYRMKIPFGFDARIENHDVILTKHWTILDAERGDIIAYGEYADGLFCLRCVSGGYVYYWACYWDYQDEDEPNERYQKFVYDEPGSVDAVHGGPYRPATEEERQKFFKEMEEAGYEWDPVMRKPKPKGEEVIPVSIEG